MPGHAVPVRVLPVPQGQRGTRRRAVTRPVRLDPEFGAGVATGAAPCDRGGVGTDRADVVAVYERYLARCNEHRFDELGEFVSEQVSGSGPVDGLAGYIEGVEAVCTAFPDYRWELQELVVEHDVIAARLVGQGTHTGPFSGIAPTGRRIRTQELVMYRFADGKIVRCWGDLFPVVRDALRTPAHPGS